jgi:nucleoid-associated protein EbfC
MMNNMGNMGNMMKKVQQLQQDMGKLQEELKTRILDSSAGGGAVKVTINGEKKLLSIKLDPAAVDPEDTEMLEDLILAAVNEAITKVDDMMAQEMGKLTGGMKIPGLF